MFHEGGIEVSAGTKLGLNLVYLKRVTECLQCAAVKQTEGTLKGGAIWFLIQASAPSN